MKKYLRAFAGFVALLSLLSFLAGCVPLNYNATARMYRDRSNINHNVLITGQPQKRFESVWGPPTRTYSYRAERGPHGQYAWTPFGGGGSYSVRGGHTYDLWFYQEKQVTLAFDRGELMFWHWGAEPPDESRLAVPASVELHP